MKIAPSITYWDTSAIVSVLFHDDRSTEAMTIAKTPATHVISSLACAETHAVIARIERERALANALVDAARETFSRGPWRRLTLDPDGTIVARLARAWPLRGADLWHLATAKTLQAEIPELTFLTFDTRLNVAARGEGLTIPG